MATIPGTPITVLPRGPYLVKGAFTLLDVDGNELHVDRDVIALCRCGASSTKPFCDGTHARIGFDSDTQGADQAA